MILMLLRLLELVMTTAHPSVTMEIARRINVMAIMILSQKACFKASQDVMKVVVEVPEKQRWPYHEYSK